MMTLRIASLLASSGRMNAETGSPGAIARKMKTRIVIPSRIGMAINTRRMM